MTDLILSLFRGVSSVARFVLPGYFFVFFTCARVDVCVLLCYIYFVVYILSFIYLFLLEIFMNLSLEKFELNVVNDALVSLSAQILRQVNKHQPGEIRAAFERHLLEVRSLQSKIVNYSLDLPKAGK